MASLQVRLTHNDTESNEDEMQSSPLPSPKRIPQMSARRTRRSMTSQLSMESTATSTESITKLAYGPTDMRFPDAPQTREDAQLRAELSKAQREVEAFEEELVRERLATSAACQELIDWVSSTSEPLLSSTIQRASAQGVKEKRIAGCLPSW